MKYLALILVLLATTLHGQTARDIINRYLDTVSNGNVENWYKIKSIYTESESHYSQEAFDQKLNFTNSDKPSFNKTYLAYPNNYRIVERYNMKIESYKDSAFTIPSSVSYFLTDKTVLLMANLPPIVKDPFEPDDYFSPHTPVFIRNIMNKSKSVELIGTKQFLWKEMNVMKYILRPGKRIMCYTLIPRHFASTMAILVEIYQLIHHQSPGSTIIKRLMTSSCQCLTAL